MTNKIYAHPGQPQMQVEVILASASPVAEAPNIYTIRLRYPRIIHGEIMTHRVFSRNARSSRAVPVRTMLLETTTIPFIPWHWGANQKGMQASEECNETVWIQSALMPLDGYAYGHSSDWDGEITEKTGVLREDAWLIARDRAVQSAEAFMDAGYHKQNVNRLLEPFSWIDTLITATDWENFLHLRDHKDAEPHLQDLARLVKQAIEECEVQQLAFGQWHLPYITQADVDVLLIESGRLAGERYASLTGVDDHVEWLKIISAARCARISYKPFDGDASYEREIERYNSLVTSERIHASPLEHQAKPDRQDPDEPNTGKWEYPMLHGNFTGWIQSRKTIPGESLPGCPRRSTI